MCIEYIERNSIDMKTYKLDVFSTKKFTIDVPEVKKYLGKPIFDESEIDGQAMFIFVDKFGNEFVTTRGEMA